MTFLAWAANPELVERKQMGVRIVLFLVFLTGADLRGEAARFWADVRASERDGVRPVIPSPVIGIIGGSGLYDIDGLEDKAWRQVDTPWGAPSDELLFGRLDGVRCVFLPRHGRGHRPRPPI